MNALKDKVFCKFSNFICPIYRKLNLFHKEQCDKGGGYKPELHETTREIRKVYNYRIGALNSKLDTTTFTLTISSAHL